MSSQKRRLSIFFVCAGNACRSQIAEGWAKHLFPLSRLAADFDFVINSAGLEAHGLNPHAVTVMRESGLDISKQTSDVLPECLEQQSWLITLCDHAAQHCPETIPSDHRRHWNLTDPAQVQPLDGDVLPAFRKTRDELKVAIQQLIAELEQRMAGCDISHELCEFGPDDVEVNRATLYQGFLQIQQLQIRHRLYRGGWSELFQRELMVKNPAVMILLYDPQRDEVVLIEQFRVGALQDKRSPWLLEMVAGIVEPGEALLEVAKREALEEAGCRVQNMEQIMQMWMTPGCCDEQITLFCGRVDASQAGGIYGLADEHEDIRVKVMTVDDAMQALKAGLITNAASIIALQWLQLNKTELQWRWRDTSGDA